MSAMTPFSECIGGFVVSYLAMSRQYKELNASLVNERLGLNQEKTGQILKANIHCIFFFFVNAVTMMHHSNSFSIDGAEEVASLSSGSIFSIDSASSRS